jgi:hypothetical protein
MRITLDPDHVLPDSNTANNVEDDKGTIEKKDVILDGYLGTFSKLWSKLKRIREKRCLECFDWYPSFQQNWLKQI